VAFTVEDRDRSKGIFYVRYIDPDVDQRAAASKGESWMDKLMFWRSAPRAQAPQFRIVVSDAGPNASNVVVQDAKGTAESSATGKRILSLLYDQLK
jgi:outer membrane protein assembly factor BamC